MTAGEELHDLAPVPTGAGFRYELSYTVTDLRTPAVNTVGGTMVAHLKASGVRRDGERRGAWCGAVPSEDVLKTPE